MSEEIHEISVIEDDVTDVTDVTRPENLDFGVTSKIEDVVTDVTATQGEATPSSAIIRPGEATLLDKPVPHIPHTKRPCWHVYDDWTTLDNGQLMRPGVYWLHYKEDNEGEVTLMEKWIFITEPGMLKKYHTMLIGTR